MSAYLGKVSFSLIIHEAKADLVSRSCVSMSTSCADPDLVALAHLVEWDFMSVIVAEIGRSSSSIGASQGTTSYLSLRLTFSSACFST